MLIKHAFRETKAVTCVNNQQNVFFWYKNMARQVWARMPLVSAAAPPLSSPAPRVRLYAQQQQLLSSCLDFTTSYMCVRLLQAFLLVSSAGFLFFAV